MDEGVECLLCPHSCILTEEKNGKCFVRKVKDDKIYLFTYGCLTHLAVEPIEKKPFLYFLSGTKTLSLGGIGCNMQCKFCENFKYSQPLSSSKFSFNTFNYKTDDEIDDNICSPKDIVEIAKKEKCDSVCMTYNEPIVYYEFLMDLAEECHKESLKFVIKTNAYVNKEPWVDICSVVDAMDIDWKGKEADYKALGASQYVIQDRIKEAYESGVHVEISFPLHQDASEKINTFAAFGFFLASIDKKMPVHLLKIYPTDRNKDCHTTSNNLVSMIKSILSFYLDNVHIHI